MSQENVEIVRTVFAAWNARPGQPDFAIFHPELVYHPRADEPDPSPHVGRDAYERLIRGFGESFVEVTFEVQELIDGTPRSSPKIAICWNRPTPMPSWIWAGRSKSTCHRISRHADAQTFTRFASRSQ